MEQNILAVTLLSSTQILVTKFLLYGKKTVPSASSSFEVRQMFYAESVLMAGSYDPAGDCLLLPC